MNKISDVSGHLRAEIELWFLIRLMYYVMQLSPTQISEALSKSDDPLDRRIIAKICSGEENWDLSFFHKVFKESQQEQEEMLIQLAALPNKDFENLLGKIKYNESNRLQRDFKGLRARGMKKYGARIAAVRGVKA